MKEAQREELTKEIKRLETASEGEILEEFKERFTKSLANSKYWKIFNENLLNSAMASRLTQ